MLGGWFPPYNGDSCGAFDVVLGGGLPILVGVSWVHLFLRPTPSIHRPGDWMVRRLSDPRRRLSGGGGLRGVVVLSGLPAVGLAARIYLSFPFKAGDST